MALPATRLIGWIEVDANSERNRRSDAPAHGETAFNALAPRNLRRPEPGAFRTTRRVRANLRGLSSQLDEQFRLLVKRLAC